MPAGERSAIGGPEFQADRLDAAGGVAYENAAVAGEVTYGQGSAGSRGGGDFDRVAAGPTQAFDDGRHDFRRQGAGVPGDEGGRRGGAVGLLSEPEAQGRGQSASVGERELVPVDAARVLGGEEWRELTLAVGLGETAFEPGREGLVVLAVLASATGWVEPSEPTQVDRPTDRVRLTWATVLIGSRGLLGHDGAQSVPAGQGRGVGATLGAWGGRGQEEK